MEPIIHQLPLDRRLFTHKFGCGLLIPTFSQHVSTETFETNCVISTYVAYSSSPAYVAPAVDSSDANGKHVVWAHAGRSVKTSTSQHEKSTRNLAEKSASQHGYYTPHRPCHFTTRSQFTLPSILKIRSELKHCTSSLVLLHIFFGALDTLCTNTESHKASSPLSSSARSRPSFLGSFFLGALHPLS